MKALRKIGILAAAVAVIGIVGCRNDAGGTPDSPSPATVPEGFVKVPGISITGTETWTPSSQVFVSGRALEIKSFYMSDHEVTRAEYKEVMGSATRVQHPLMTRTAKNLREMMSARIQ